MKRILYILSLIVLSLVLLTGVGVALLSSSDLQTRAVGIVTAELSAGIHSDLRIGRVDYRLPATIHIEDIYLADQQKDTLLYVRDLYARLRFRDLMKNKVTIQKTRVDGVFLNLHDSNYVFLQPLLVADSLPVLKTFIAAPDIRVSDTRLRYDDHLANVQELRVQLNALSSDTLHVELVDLQGCYSCLPYLKEGIKPMRVRHLHTELIMNKDGLCVPDLQVRLPHSLVNIDEILFNRNQTLVKLDDLTFCPADIGMIVPALSNLDSKLHVQALMQGSLDSLVLQRLSMQYNRQQVLAADVVVRGLPNLDSTYIKATCHDFYINAGIVQDIISDIKNTPFNLPASVNSIGAVHYRGQVSGWARSLTLKGAFRTALGSITTDGALQFDSTFRALTFHGGIATKSFRLGKVIGAQEVGNISFNVNTDLVLTPERLQAQLAMLISEFELLDYTYRDIRLNGEASRNAYSGSVAINDSNIVFGSEVYAQREGGRYLIDLEMGLRKFLPGALHLGEAFSQASAMSHLWGHASFSNWEDLNAELFIDSLELRNGRDSIRMDELHFTHESGEGHYKQIKLTSDFLAGALIGQVEYRTLPTTFKKWAVQYTPQLFGKDARRRIMSEMSDNNFRFYLYGRELKQLQRVLRLPVRVSDYPVMKGYCNEMNNQWVVQGYVPSIAIGRTKVEDITFATDNLAARANADFSARTGSTKVVLHSFAQDDSCQVALTVKNIDPARKDSNRVTTKDEYKPLLQQEQFIEGDLLLSAHFAQYAEYPLVDVHLYPSYLQYGDSVYHIDDARLSYCVADTMLTVDHFRIGTKNQFIEANGIGSPSPNDELAIQLGELEADYLINLLLAKKALTVQGKMTGWAKAYSLFSTPAFEADVVLKEVGLNGYPIGDAVGKVMLDRSNYNILIDVDVAEGDKQVAHMDGLVETTGDKRWGLDIYPDSISAGFINHWTTGFITDISGRAFGEVHVFGKEKSTWVTAKAYADNIGLTIPFTGCRYYVSDSVFLDSTAIVFPDMTLHDEEGNEVYVDGRLEHNEYFADFKFNIFAEPKNALVFNLPYKQGEMLSGKTYADGNVRIEGDEQLVTLTANAVTTGNSTFRFNVSYASSASDNSFITFYNRNDVGRLTEDDDDEYFGSFLRTDFAPATRFKMALNVEVQPNVLFGLMLNERTGDEIKARGDGALTIGYDDLTNIVTMVGTYTVQSGTMGFTVGNMIRRDFTLVDGGQIVWSGVPELPLLDVTANYTVTASLKDLFGSDVMSVATSRTNIPVTTSINLTGGLDNPQIHFALSLPQSEQEIADKVKTIINTDEMLMRQVIYLLVFSRFYTPDYMATTTTVGTNEMYSLVSSTITGQINNWLGKLTNVFSMGINVRKDGQGADAAYEAEAKFQLQPIDRLVINGDIGYRYNDITNRPFFGDVDVEYMLTKNGKFRIKGYTHMVDKYSLRQASTIQGIGFVFKHDFNWPKSKKKNTPKDK